MDMLTIESPKQNSIDMKSRQRIPASGQVQLYDETARIQLVPLTLIEANPFQTRVRFDERDIISLAEDIRRQREFLPDTLGLLQVPKGRITKDGRIQLVFGHRRLAAFCYLAQCYGGEWLQMPIQIEELDDETMADMAWSENQVRSDISAIERAWALQQVRDQFGYSNLELAQRRGLDPGTLCNLLRLLQLPDEVQAMILRRELSERHGRALVSLLQITKNETVVSELATVAVENKLSAAQLDEKVSDTILRLTVEIEPHVTEFEEWENAMPAGCATLCSRCEFSTARKRRLYCAQPELYQQKYRIWRTKMGQAEENDADNPASASTSVLAASSEAEDWAEFTADEEEAIRQPVLSIFQCPRCHQEEVTIDNVMRYQCAGCNAKWLTIAGLLQEINIGLAKTINPAAQINGLLESKLDQTRLQALLTQGVRFSEGQTWNMVPTHKCLGCKVNFEELKQSLKYGSGEFLPQADGIVTHFCQHLRLFPYFTSQFVPNANGAIELKVAEADLNLYPPQTVSRTRLRVRGNYSYLLDNIRNKG